jgi:uncharacterized caspase-like protein
MQARYRARLACLLTLLPAFLPAVMPQAADAAPKRLMSALIIGNASYINVTALKNPANDAGKICAALSSLGFQASCSIDVPTRADMRALIEDYVDSLPDDAVRLVYYAGHGLQVNGENYLIPTGARLTNEQSVPEQTVSLSYLMRQLRRKPGYLSIVILDACRNNPLATGDHLLTPGLAKITDIPDSTVVLYATADSGVAIDDLGDDGTLTRNLLAHVHDVGTIDDLFTAVRRGVRADTAPFPHPQRPALYTNFTGQYCFVRCTDLEILQRRQQEAEQKIADLNERAQGGDDQARRELSGALAENEKLLAEIRRKDEDRRKKAYIIPAN